MQANEGQGSEASQQQSGSVTPASQETADSCVQADTAPAGEHPMEKNYTDTIESLLSELWKERLVRHTALLMLSQAFAGFNCSSMKLGCDCKAIIKTL